MNGAKEIFRRVHFALGIRMLSFGVEFVAFFTLTGLTLFITRYH